MTKVKSSIVEMCDIGRMPGSIKVKALAFLEELVTKAVEVYKLMEKWLGERYLNEMAR